MNCYIQHLSKDAMLSFKNTLLKGGNKTHYWKCLLVK